MFHLEPLLYWWLVFHHHNSFKNHITKYNPFSKVLQTWSSNKNTSLNNLFSTRRCIKSLGSNPVLQNRKQGKIEILLTFEYICSKVGRHRFETESQVSWRLNRTIKFTEASVWIRKFMTQCLLWFKIGSFQMTKWKKNIFSGHANEAATSDWFLLTASPLQLLWET